MQALDETECGETTIAHGFKIDDFPPGRGARSLLAAVEARDRHIELYWLLKAMRAHAQIPSTFDDRTPEEAFSPERIAPLRIGETYLVPDCDGHEVPGVLEDAVVLENERAAYGSYRLGDDQRVLCSTPLTESEMVRYRQSPQTFFGIVKDQSRRIDDPLDAYDFFYETYFQTPKAKLLESTARIDHQLGTGAELPPLPSDVRRFQRLNAVAGPVAHLQRAMMMDGRPGGQGHVGGGDAGGDRGLHCRLQPAHLPRQPGCQW